jgi:hypothetical protein
LSKQASPAQETEAVAKLLRLAAHVRQTHPLAARIQPRLPSALIVVVDGTDRGHWG